MLAVLALPVGALAVPGYLHHEGLILEYDGLPMEGQVLLRLSLYEQEDGGEALWREEHEVLLIGGYYHLRLGEQQGLGGLVDEGPLYLGISVDGAPELAPRHPLGTVAYAFVADNAVGDITPRSIVVAGHTVIDESGTWVGPGVDAARLDGLHRSQLLQLAHEDAPSQVLALLVEADGPGSGLNADLLDGLDGTKFLRVDQDTGTQGNLGVAGTLRAAEVLVDPGGRIGVGIDVPVAEVDIDGLLRLRPRDDEPEEPASGMVYFDAATGTFRGFDGERWITFGGGGGDGDDDVQGNVDPAALEEAILADAPSAYWPLDERGGSTAFDRSGFGRHGTYQGQVRLGLAGQAGLAVDCAAAGYVATSVNLSDLMGSQSGTVTAVVKLPDNLVDFGVDYPGHIPRHVWSTWAWYQGVSVGTFGGVAGVHFWNFYTGSNDHRVHVAAEAGAWVHLAWVKRDGRFLGYVNGEEHSVAAAQAMDSMGLFNIGRRHQGQTYPPTYPSLIQHVATFPTGLSAERIRAQADAAGVTSALGGDENHPAVTCKGIKDADPEAESGWFWIRPADATYRVWCDMETVGGGWTRVGRLRNQAAGWCQGNPGGGFDLQANPELAAGKIRDSEVQAILRAPGAVPELMFYTGVGGRGNFMRHLLLDPSHWVTSSRNGRRDGAYCTAWTCGDGSADNTACGGEGDGCPVVGRGRGGNAKKLYIDAHWGRHAAGVHSGGGFCGLDNRAYYNADVYVR